MVQLTEKQKYEIIILREHNYKINDIADEMKINRNTVMFWINKYQKDKNINRKKGSGRKEKTSINEDNRIIDIIEKNNDLSLIDIKNILEDSYIFISKQTIYRRLIGNEYIHKFPIKNPFLTEDHKKKRLEWAFDNIERDWYEIIFSDESAMRIFEIIKKKWIKKDKIDIQKTVKYPLKINIWGCFYGETIGPINTFSENMNSDKYIQILKDNLIPINKKTKNKLIFQHDNDPKHTAKKTVSFLKDNEIPVLKWPSCSPDLNPIENVWSILKNKVRKRKPTNKNEFIEIIEDEWKNFDKKILKSLIDSMPNRILEVIKNKGDVIMY